MPNYRVSAKDQNLHQKRSCCEKQGPTSLASSQHQGLMVLHKKVCCTLASTKTMHLEASQQNNISETKLISHKPIDMFLYCDISYC